MKVRARRSAGVTGGTDHATLRHDLSWKDIDAAQMAIIRFVAITVVNDDQVTISVNVPSGPGNSPCIRSNNRCALR